ncbi:methylated-DNA--[protein]-cysteine S-methyltransferase [uncultured Alistipes sp.]|uniref:methylated-DNA--[protein]-cysteine S-methyltransferase n=1 Tax=uncultured Alistipes sp. TaxID=538949 RepID=UPI0026244F21|nr:methylated-DNA--[protein]-cysteine S-methyltransferase [uncultured Alistipes sp.]
MGLYRKEIMTPCGPLTLLCDGRALTAVRFGREADGAATAKAAQAGAEMFEKVMPTQQTQEARAAQEILEQAAREIGEYFEGKRRAFAVPTAAAGTPFQQAVWNALKEIPYGETRTYGEIARRIGHPRASRAVGQANNRNPLPIVVPCHRVIGTSGALTGYAGGLAVKERLLELERTPRRRSCSAPENASSC